MTTTPPRVTDSPEWASLVDHQRVMTDVHLRQLFADDPDRADAATPTTSATCTSTWPSTA